VIAASVTAFPRDSGFAVPSDLDRKLTGFHVYHLLSRKKVWLGRELSHPMKSERFDPFVLPRFSAKPKVDR